MNNIVRPLLLIMQLCITQTLIFAQTERTYTLKMDTIDVNFIEYTITLDGVSYVRCYDDELRSKAFSTAVEGIDKYDFLKFLVEHAYKPGFESLNTISNQIDLKKDGTIIKLILYTGFIGNKISFQYSKEDLVKLISDMENVPFFKRWENDVDGMHIMTPISRRHEIKELLDSLRRPQCRCGCKEAARQGHLLPE